MHLRPLTGRTNKVDGIEIKPPLTANANSWFSLASELSQPMREQKNYACVDDVCRSNIKKSS